MSSEQMRVELEIFVNEGLQAGWRGWPLKSETPKGRTGRGRAGGALLQLWRGGRRKPVSPIGRRGPVALSA
jgi:hypothetical protein